MRVIPQLILALLLNGWLFVFLQAVSVLTLSHGEDHTLAKDAIQLAIDNGCKIEKKICLMLRHFYVLLI